MPARVTCPNPDCGKTTMVADDLLSQMGRCPRCRTKFRLGEAAGEGRPTGKETMEQPPARFTQDGGAAAVPREVRSAPKEMPATVGRFRVLGQLGAGATGRVFRAHDPQLDREVALKVPHPGVLDSPQRVERFLREAKAAARLRHPNVVPVFDAGRDGDWLYIASAFIDGKPLSESIKSKGIDPQEAARLVRELAEAAAYLHEQGIVHRDIKPSNVIVDAAGHPMLLDFGLAAELEAKERITRTGAVLGTPAYIAPEMAKGQQGEAHPACDQYALGVVLYELLTGRPPFEGPPQVVLYNTVHNDPEPPRKRRKDLPWEIEAICLKAIEKEPDGRYGSCRSFAADLRRWLDGDPIRARKVGGIDRLSMWSSIPCNQTWTSVISLMFIAFVVGVMSTAIVAAISDKELSHANFMSARDGIILWTWVCIMFSLSLIPLFVVWKYRVVDPPRWVSQFGLTFIPFLVGTFYCWIPSFVTTLLMGGVRGWIIVSTVILTFLSTIPSLILICLRWSYRAADSPLLWYLRFIVPFAGAVLGFALTYYFVKHFGKHF